MKGEEQRGLSMSDERAKPCKSASVSSSLALSIAIILVASFTPSYSPRPTRRVLLAESSPLAPSLTSYSSLCIVQLPCVSFTLRAALTLSQNSPSYSPHLTCNHTRRVLLAIVLAVRTLLDIILAASYARSYLPWPTRYRSRRRHPH